MARQVTRQFIVGMEELERKLDSLRYFAKKAEFKGLFVDAAEVVKASILSEIKSTLGKKTGNLERAVIAEPSRGMRPGAWVKVMLKRAPHAHLLEFGHRIVGHKPNLKDTGKRVRDYPFFRQGVFGAMLRIRAMIRDGVKRIMEAA